MMRSLYSGVAGLKTHQTKMDVIGNNIANVNTTSFKSQSITFSDLMYQTTQTASGATLTKGGVNARQIGLGAKSGAITTAISSQGATQTTNNPFDLMITGKAFFVVNNGTENLYTRDGSFYVDGAGNLAMQSNGYLVQGWVAQEDKETGEITVNKNGGLSSLQIMSADNTTYSPASTTAGLFSGNIDDNDTNVTSDDGKTITLEFYDNKGYLYTGKFVLKDTGTDHLFSLQLTDIIDSDGNTIGKERLAGVTFGETQSVDNEVTDAYEVEVGQTTAVINLLAGAVEYEGVPATGALSDLMTISKSKYAGILQKVYGITDQDVTSGVNGYSKTSLYTITESGSLTITYDAERASAKPDGFTYNANNLSSYYVDKNGTGKAYLVPTNGSGSMNKISQSTKTTLQNVFGLNDAEISAYTTSSDYMYSFASVENGNDIFTIYRDPNLKGTIEPSSIQKSKLNQYFDDFPDLKAAGEDATSAYSTYSDPIFYNYDAENRYLTIYGSTYDTASGVVPKNYTKLSTDYPYSTLSKGEVYTYSGLTDAQKAELADILHQTGVLADSDVATLDTFMLTDNNYTHFAIQGLTGDDGILFYNSMPKTVADISNVLVEGQAYTDTREAKEDLYPSSNSDEIGAVFTNTTDYSAYVLSGEESVLSDYTSEFLEEVYGLDASKFSANLQVTIRNNGDISIFETTTKTPEINSDYAAQKAADGTITYVTTKDTVAYDDVPLSGDIKDLLTSSTGPYKDLLKKVYGLTDEDADAYGSDGTYQITADGGITLTTGSQTIQLVFDPATGGLTTANGNTNGFVDVVFDQTIPGNEAFGYQLSAVDGDDVVPGHVTLDFSTVTNYNTSGASTIKAVKGDKKSLNTGRAVGELNGISVSTDGQIYATYSNGQTKLLGQIASAEFANASGLAKEGDNLYSATLNSGEATVQDITTDGGYMNTGVLEMSNVDLSMEFTDMITTQRGFQANSRIITVSDTLLEELTNLKR
jgi:flagellar hook protein FlgE